MSKLPVGAVPAAIGKVVTINVFDRESEDSDTLDLSSMMKYVGVLELFFARPEGFVFQIKGSTAVGVDYKRQRVEVHTYTPNYRIG